MIPTNDIIHLYKRGKKDSWGIAAISDEPILLKGSVSYATEIIELKNTEGKAVNVTGNIVFIGKADITNNDVISIGADIDTKVDVLKVKFITDLSGKVILTKVVF